MNIIMNMKTYILVVCVICGGYAAPAVRRTPKVMTAKELFHLLDANDDGIISQTEMLGVGETAGMGSANLIDGPIIIDKSVCSCFHCNGRQFWQAKTCDVYERSGCGAGAGAGRACYTTQPHVCECNMREVNQYMCNIPLTYSFVGGGWGGVCGMRHEDIVGGEKMKKHLEEEEMKDRAAREKAKERKKRWQTYEYEGVEYDRRREYQKGRDSAVNDAVQATAGFMVADTLFNLALGGKE